MVALFGKEIFFFCIYISFNHIRYNITTKIELLKPNFCLTNNNHNILYFYIDNFNEYTDDEMTFLKIKLKRIEEVVKISFIITITENKSYERNIRLRVSTRNETFLIHF